MLAGYRATQFNGWHGAPVTARSSASAAESESAPRLPLTTTQAARRQASCSRASARTATSGGHLSHWRPDPPRPPRSAEKQGGSPENLHLRGPWPSRPASARSRARGQTGARRRPVRSPPAVAFATPFFGKMSVLASAGARAGVTGADRRSRQITPSTGNNSQHSGKPRICYIANLA